MAKRSRRVERGGRAASNNPRPASGRSAVRPGTFNLAGDLFTPTGARLSCVETDVDEERAAALVRAGAEVAFESCGCGGGGGCKPIWPGGTAIETLAAAALPRVHVHAAAPTWIDVWAGDGVTAVFCHGDITWGSVLPSAESRDAQRSAPGGATRAVRGRALRTKPGVG